MALVKCPECGRENVSDTAVQCPNCGYAIKAHFDRIRLNKQRIELEKQAEIRKQEIESEQKRRQEERIKNVPKLKKPQLTAPIVITVIAALIMLLGFSTLRLPQYSSRGDGDPHFQGVFLIIFGVCVLGCAINLFEKRISAYNLSRNNFEEYQRQVICEQDEAQRRWEAERTAKAKQQANMPKCPNCGSTNTVKIGTLNRAASVVAVGLASSKIGKQYQCKNCKHKW